jgi:hypothetical protein
VKLACLFLIARSHLLMRPGTMCDCALKQHWIAKGVAEYWFQEF